MEPHIAIHIALYGRTPFLIQLSVCLCFQFWSVCFDQLFVCVLFCLSSSCDKSDAVSFLAIVMYLILEAINYYYYNSVQMRCTCKNARMILRRGRLVCIFLGLVMGSTIQVLLN